MENKLTRNVNAHIADSEGNPESLDDMTKKIAKLEQYLVKARLRKEKLQQQLERVLIQKMGNPEDVSTLNRRSKVGGAA